VIFVVFDGNKQILYVYLCTAGWKTLNIKKSLSVVLEMHAKLGLSLSKLQHEITVRTPTNCTEHSISDNKQRTDSICHACMAESFAVTMESM
jgi:hypothetical protein